MELIFRRYREGDEFGITELLKTCFRTFNSWNITANDWLGFEESDYGFKRENALVAEYSGRIVGHVHVVYRRIRIGRSFLDIGGIANVSTHPDFRGRGIATKLMSMALDLCREKGWALSSLLTGYASTGHRVYRSLGYADTFFLYEYIGTRERTEKAIEVLGLDDVEFDELREEYVEDVSDVYYRWSTKFSAMVWRPIEYWRERILRKTFYYSYFYDDRDAGIRIVAKKNSRIVGYALALNSSRTRREYWSRGTGVVLEVVALNNTYAKALLKRILEIFLREDVKLARLFIPFDKSYRNVLKFFEKLRGAIYMDYIVDQTKLFNELKSELKHRLSKLPREYTLSIDIESPYGCTELSIDRDRIEVSSLCRSRNRVVFTRDGIAKLIYGIESFKKLLVDGYIDRVELDEKSIRVLNWLFPKRRAYVSLIDQW